MEKEKHIPIVGDWYVGTDGMSFVLQKKRIVQAGKQVKEENVGQERFEPMGYYASLGSLAAGLHRYLSMDVLISGCATTLEEFVQELRERIAGIQRLDESLLHQMEQQMGVQNE